MAKTSRVVNRLYISFKKLQPLLIGFVFILFFSYFLGSFLIERKNSDFEVLSEQRNQLVKEYDTYVEEFNSLSQSIIKISIIDTEVLETPLDLDRTNQLNIKLKSLSEQILTLSRSINKIQELPLEKDIERLKNHNIYSDLINSLEQYQGLVLSYRDSRSCFDSIDINGEDSKVRSQIEKCKSSSELVLRTYYEKIYELDVYWSKFIDYWDVVYRIHNKPPQDSILSLQKELEEKFKELQKEREMFYSLVDKRYRGDYLEKLTDSLSIE